MEYECYCSRCNGDGPDEPEGPVTCHIVPGLEAGKCCATCGYYLLGMYCGKHILQYDGYDEGFGFYAHTPKWAVCPDHYPTLSKRRNSAMTQQIERWRKVDDGEV